MALSIKPATYLVLVASSYFALIFFLPGGMISIHSVHNFANKH
jgi:hypothetical protein